MRACVVAIARGCRIYRVYQLLRTVFVGLDRYCPYTRAADPQNDPIPIIRSLPSQNISYPAEAEEAKPFNTGVLPATTGHSY